ncbi:C40 family peptidase [Verrucomicrobium sp. 3C]|uniref:C40 family peptidase n=1 Tax=Verrucomicrobium sp. 3C TaxID=1134055 RepID=UPI0003666012|nr:NlpC/P60 family protein [Verrucomicrobium sp. 3C]
MKPKSEPDPPGPSLRFPLGARLRPAGSSKKITAEGCLLVLALLFSVAPAGAQGTPQAAEEEKRPAGMAPDASLTPEELADFDRQPTPVQELIRQALLLTTKDLTYRYGSADPTTGGIDCSGFVYFVLRQCGIRDVPRTSSGQYVWVRKAGNFRAAVSRDPKTFEMDELRPGDLLFWEGTYATKNDPPITHSMIYLGREKASGERVMVGSSDGRTYHGKQRWGASVFDLWPKFPGQAAAPSSSRFVGYGKIPGLGIGNGRRATEEREE